MTIYFKDETRDWLNSEHQRTGESRSKLVEEGLLLLAEKRKCG